MSHEERLKRTQRNLDDAREASLPSFNINPATLQAGPIFESRLMAAIQHMFDVHGYVYGIPPSAIDADVAEMTHTAVVNLLGVDRILAARVNK